MAYRGDDLDLRTSQTWSATPADLATTSTASSNGQRTSLRNGPMWVDETVLACSNHAYDVALAHRAGEVRIEHLLHALTRIDAAAEALEARGVRVAALRRESATIIASEIPVGLPNGKGSPRRSEDFAEVLRLASASAARRGAPASISDLLNVLFDQRADYSALGLLSRNMTRGNVRDTVEPMPRYVSDTRFVATPADRYTRSPMIDAVRYTSPRPVRTEFTQAATDKVQNTRIEALEQMVRSLGNDLANEREVFSTMLQDLSRETLANRDDQSRLHSSLFDRMDQLQTVVGQGGSGRDGFGEQHLSGIEDVIERRLKSTHETTTLLNERLQSLEGLMRQIAATKPNGTGVSVENLRQAIDLSPLINRLDIIEEAVLARGEGADAGELGNRMRTHEAEIMRVVQNNSARIEEIVSGFSGPTGDTSGPVMERFNALIRVLESQQAALANLQTTLTDRLSAVEQAVTGEIQTAAAKHEAYTHDLSDVHEALMKLNQNQHTLAGSIDQWRTDSAVEVASVSNKLAALDRDNEQPIETLNALSAHMDSMNKLMIERYHRRNRFWYWLFGTDDWIGRSWPSQAAAMEAEKQRFKINSSTTR